jgi:hypothetical protein
VGGWTNYLLCTERAKPPSWGVGAQDLMGESVGKGTRLTLLGGAGLGRPWLRPLEGRTGTPEGI